MELDENPSLKLLPSDFLPKLGQRSEAKQGGLAINRNRKRLTRLRAETSHGDYFGVQARDIQVSIDFLFSDSAP